MIKDVQNLKHEEFTDIDERHLAKDVTAAEVAAEQIRLLQELTLTPLQEFDSVEKTEGKKIVTLCTNADGEKVILRLGERRPDWFFPEGYNGEYLQIPKMHAAGGERIPYEVEEFVQGQMISEIPSEQEWSHRGQNSPDVWAKLIPAFWEFQDIAKALPLTNLNQQNRIHDFLDMAGELIPEGAKELIDTHANFWADTYPAKWKFATDNLMLDEVGRVIFIDNANVSGRFFAFDIGWIIWPRWVEMDTAAFADIASQLTYLETVKKQFLSSIPEGAPRPKNPELGFDLMLFERLVGSLFDVKREVRHFADWGMAGEEGRGRREAHRDFLQALLKDVMTRL